MKPTRRGCSVFGPARRADFLDGMNRLLFPLPENRPAGRASEDEDIEEPEEPEGPVVFPELPRKG